MGVKILEHVLTGFLIYSYFKDSVRFSQFFLGEYVT